ncbi:MAG: hypothetical protein J6T28_02905 [Paludibacteraceae bacterium]|nr:hypothetical protein [Paludibacteraceae bacterium]
MSFLGRKLRENLSGGCKHPFSKLKWAVTLGLFFFVSWQEASAYSSWADGRDLDEITWEPQKGRIHYKIRVYQSGGGAMNRPCGWVDSPLIITQNTSVKHVISILVDEDGIFEKATIDGRSLQYVKTKETLEVDGDRQTILFAEFYVPVSQEDIKKEVSVDLEGVWWRYGATVPDEEIEERSYRTLTLNYPADPGLEITKVYYGCSDEANNPMIYFDWTRKDTSDLHAVGVVSLCEADSSTHTSVQGRTFQSANSKIPFSVVAYTSPYHDLSKSYTYKLIQETELNVSQNGIESNLKYVFESDKVVVNAYPQVSNITCRIANDTTLSCDWKIGVAPSENYDDGSFLLTIKKSIGNNVTEETKEIEYVAGKTDYSYELPIMRGNVKYEFSVVRSSTKELSCYDKLRRSVSATISAGAPAYPKNPHASLFSYPAGVKISWGKVGDVWKKESLLAIRRTDLASSEVSVDTLTAADFEDLSYIDYAEPCKTYSYELIYKQVDDEEEHVLKINEEVATIGCDGEDPLVLTILDGANGKTNLQLDATKTYKFRFVPDEGWMIGSVSFNDEDATDQLQEDFFEVSSIIKNSTLSVVYKMKAASPAPRLSDSWTRVWTSEGNLIIKNAPFGSDVTVTDLMGSVIYSGKVDSGEMTIGSIGSGIFLVNVAGEVFKVSL